jgi:cellulose synthase/poly-beta-1,6-N-acetylglucosamine synthase-like glycosyltransferase
MMQIEPDASRKPPRASIIIPALDERVALPGTLEAIGRQAAEGLEVILADGGSTDGTVELFFALTRCWMGRGWAVRSRVARSR